MTSENISVHFTPEFENERIVTVAANVDVTTFELSAETVHGEITAPVEHQIIELELTPVVVNFRGKRYKFAFLNRAGEFTLHRAW